MLGPLFALWMTHPSVLVDGQATCPSAVEVQRRLGDLMAGVRDDLSQDRARIETTTDGLRIELRRDDGSLIAERLLGAKGSCADLASASAVVIATWEAQLRPVRTARIQLPPEDRAGSAPAVAREAPSPAASRSSLEAGLGGVGSLAFGDATEPALGGLVFGTWSPRGAGLGLHAALAGTAARTSSLTTSVTTSWTRAFLQVGPSYRLLVGPARVDAHAGALAGALFVSAAGVPSARSDASLDFGASLGVRLSTRWAPMAPWLGIEGLFWPARDRLAISGISTTREVPRLEAWLAIGVTFVRSQ